jgi:hypothetical protein
MLLIVSGPACLFFNVAVFATLATPTARLPKDSVAGVNVLWADADEPRTRRERRRTVPPKNSFVPYFAGLELELRK